MAVRAPEGEARSGNAQIGLFYRGGTMKGIIALAGTVAMALAGILSSTAAVSAPATHGSKPTVEAIDPNLTSMSPYRGHGKLHFAEGPSAWLSHPDFFKWNGTEAKASGSLWGADVGPPFNLGRHATLAFFRVRNHRFTELSILHSHGIATRWHLQLSDHSWMPGS